MYRLTTEESFDSAHFLSGYNGKCGNIHGHRWRVLVTVEMDELRDDIQQRGMLVDFTELKDELRDMIKSYDHTFLIEKGSLKDATLKALKNEGFTYIELDFRPTAEHFAKHFYKKMQNRGFPVYQVRVYETPNNSAEYME